MRTHTDETDAFPLAERFERYFETKTSRDVQGTMSFFSPHLVTYTDATLGWDLAGYDAVEALFQRYMPTWDPRARSYLTGAWSNETSALLQMVDTPELFGGELRILAAVDFADDKIVGGSTTGMPRRSTESCTASSGRRRRTSPGT